MKKKIYVAPMANVSGLRSEEQIMVVSISSNVGIGYGGDAMDDIISADANRNGFGDLW